ncbi:MAG: protein-L-isoaspartate(D-aspartate) O-methyltransferase [Endozoicomonas sp. (ex Botrylloides leachii)]|nr:protein-L-isoaspartate(D-aspartate) O-methyltransferase [Endozoicomonas sp. (ex Botrylloides leachii)]
MRAVDFDGIGMTSQRTRARLIARLEAKGIKSSQVLEAIKKTPRHLFVDEALSHRAYEDIALPIGYHQTLSQPYIVARMTEALLNNGSLTNVLEVGTGSGYQTAILAKLVKKVYSIERIKPLFNQACERMRLLSLSNTYLKLNDGCKGWTEVEPFDGIIVTAAPCSIPPSLLQQLLPKGGRMVIPVGQNHKQKLLLITREGNHYRQKFLESVHFVPLLSGKVY